MTLGNYWEQPAPMHRKTESTWQLGATAFHAGEPVSQNPFRQFGGPYDKMDFDGWNRGWLCAQTRAWQAKRRAEREASTPSARSDIPQDPVFISELSAAGEKSGAVGDEKSTLDQLADLVKFAAIKGYLSHEIQQTVKVALYQGRSK